LKVVSGVDKLAEIAYINLKFCLGIKTKSSKIVQDPEPALFLNFINHFRALKCGSNLTPGFSPNSVITKSQSFTL